MNVYFPNEKQEIWLKFALEEHFLSENQILKNNVIKNYKDKAEEKFTKISSVLKINQQLVQGFQEELSDTFKVSRQRIKQKLNQQRLATGNWKVDDIISINSIIDITGINEKQAVSFKVLTKNKDDFTVIIQYLNSKKQLEYKIRDITINNCGTFNFTLNKEEVTFPNWQEILKLQSLINDYIIWKDKELVEHVELLSNKLKKISNSVLSFVKVNNQNFFNNWEWEINLQKIKEKLLVTIEQEIEEYKQLIEKGQMQYEKNLKISQELKENLTNGNLNFVFSENSKENIKNLNQNKNNTNVTFDIFYYNKKYFIGSYKTETSTINFKILRDSLIAKNRLLEIKEKVAAIRKSVLIVDSKIRTAVNDLTKLHDSIIELLQIKKQEWETLTNHTIVNVQLQNQKILAQLKLDIEQLVKKISFIKNKISELSNQKIANSWFYNDYLTFIRYYEKANEVAPWSIEKYLCWDKNFNIIKNNLKIYTGYDDFDDYKTIFLSKLYNIKTIDIEHCQKSLVEISKTKFKKLSWWQKIINKLSWTWKKTKRNIKVIKENNIKNFGTLIANLNENKTSIDKISVSYQRQSIPELLPTSEPWDEWIIEKKPKLSRSNSTDSAISSLSYEFEENDYSIIDIDKILRELNSYSFPQYSDLESSTESSRQEFNHCLTRTASSDSGICSGQITPKPVSTNPFDDESDDEELAGNTINESNNLVNTVPLPSKSTPKLNFS
ncbi:hypothetical protein [Spiroplasma endosymbiont of Lasioglossum villosulum]|uniref:hypothetical protein n=1 Tax=Spiroplasma endosymbiont of Lasioglossum villosulum TaxID=3066320 RepID=UPI0030CF03DB